MEFIERRTPATRWILVPIVLIASAALIRGTVVITSKILWGGDPQETSTLFFYEVIFADGLGTFCACYFSGWTAPKYKLITTSVCASLFFVVGLLIIYFMFTTETWELSSFINTLSIILGGTIAIWMAKKEFSE